MRKYLLYLCIVLSSLLLIGATAVAQKWICVKWVSDGDTIVLSNGQHVRYVGINAPEIAHDNHKAEVFGYAAKKYNQSLVRLKKVRLEFDKEKHDRYGRLLAYIFLLDGTLINKKMIEKGYAYVLHLRPNVKYDGVLLNAQRNAMSAKQGMWRNWNEQEGKEYVGSKRSRRFHLKSCPYGKNIEKRNRVFFTKKMGRILVWFCPLQAVHERWGLRIESPSDPPKNESGNGGLSKLAILWLCLFLL